VSASGGHNRQGGTPLRLLVLLLVFGVLAGAVVAAAFGGHSKPSSGVSVVLLGTAAAKATATAAGHTTVGAPASDPNATPTAAPVLTGFAYPIDGGCLPEGDDLMPGAPRAYRNGIHEGVDFYNADNCVPIDIGTEAYAAKAGTVIRADWDYQDIMAEQVSELEAEARFNGSNPDIEDAFRGRQVWVDHGNGVVTRYCHLSGIAEGIQVGTQVEAGQLLAYVGESGTPESVSAPGTEYHLHFEIRVGDSYLGAGLPPGEVRRLYERAFAPQ
jgi:murein DD-endopeptidase MepM/ murein hydrolase activator NlpD